MNHKKASAEDMNGGLDDDDADSEDETANKKGYSTYVKIYTWKTYLIYLFLKTIISSK